MPAYLRAAGGSPDNERLGMERLTEELGLVRYDEHADQIEQAQTRRSFLKCLPGRRVMRRVVTPDADPDFVITAYFDRTKPCP